jgi:iron complex outermembrane receptor protein
VCGGKELRTVLILGLLALLPLSGMAQEAQQAEEQGAAEAEQPPIVSETIVVTPRAREENLQEAPIAVTAFTSEGIEAAAVRRAADFIALTPNVTIADAQDSGNVAINIRGIGQIRNGETPVAISVDGVLLTSPLQFNQELFDIEQIEVLRGPQGALYGRNAIAGAINITTRRPRQQRSGAIRLGVGNGESANASLSLGGPVGDSLSLRGGVAYARSDGLIENAFTGTPVDDYEDRTIRFRADWDAGERANLDFRVFANGREGGAAYFARPLLQAAGIPFVDPPVELDVANHVVAPVSNVTGFDDRDLLDLSLKFDLETPAGQLRLTGAYSSVDHLVAFDGFDYSDNTRCYLYGFSLASDALLPCGRPRLLALGPSGDPDGDDALFPAGFNTTFQDNDIRSTSQEIRLTSPGDGRVRYILGAYSLQRDRGLVTGTNEDIGGDILAALDFDPATPHATRTYFAEENDDTAFAVFGQAGFDLSESVELTLSGRYDEDQRQQTDPRPEGKRVDGFGIPIAGPATREAVFSKFQPKATLRWTTSEYSNLYLTYAEGFRSGGFNAPGTEISPFTGEPIADSVYQQEESRNFEVGFKTVWPESNLIVNGAVFAAEADDLQTFNFNGAVNAQIVRNIDVVEISGAEVEVTWLAAPGFSIFGGVGYSDAEIVEYAANPMAVGNQVPYTSKLTTNLGGQLERSLSSSVDLIVRADWEHRGKTYFHEGGTIVGVPVRDPLDFVSLRLAFQTSGYTFAIWGKNLLDERYYEEVVAPDYNYQGRPRSFGVEFVYSF